MLLSCSESKPQTPVERGKTVYMSICTACHNSDPKKDGSVGPAIFGSSEVLLRAKVLRGEYPKGYKPKRETKMMPQFPGLEKEIPNLHKFLND